MEHTHTISAAHIRRCVGFTLIELIVALTVLAAALAGLVALYGFSVHLADEARHKLLAAEVAEAQLAALLTAPDSFAWHVDNDATAWFPITELDVQLPFSGSSPQPDVKLIAPNVRSSNEAIYRRMYWQAWGRLPTTDASAYEITVAVGWQSRGRQRSLALTSSLARQAVPAPYEKGTEDP